jgi:hypothetical protein
MEVVIATAARIDMNLPVANWNLRIYFYEILDYTLQDCTLPGPRNMLPQRHKTPTIGISKHDFV